MLVFALFITLVSYSLADDPILQLFADCPSSYTSNPNLYLISDVPAYAVAKCRNGKKLFTSVDQVNFILPSSFDQDYDGDRCQFYKKIGISTYTVMVEIGWGEEDKQLLQHHRTQIISCVYDNHGRAISEEENVVDWYLNPPENSVLLGGNSSANFRLRVVDVLGEEITDDHISIGKKIRLVADDLSGNVHAMRALRCCAQNSVARYFVIRAGCGDGLVFPKTAGFITVGNRAFSPYFGAFRLGGTDNTVEFRCRFTECKGPCDGDSCSVKTARRKRSKLVPHDEAIVITSRKFYF